MPLSLSYRHDAMRLRDPLRISGYSFDAMPAVIVHVGDGMHEGRGEAAGVYYLDDDPSHMASEIERVRQAVEGGIAREGLRELLPAGGARNAIDCALWELESLHKGVPVAALAGVAPLRPLVTTFTIPAVDPAEIAGKLASLSDARALKLKLEGDLVADRERLMELRRCRPDTWLAVDANQGFARDDLDELDKLMVEARVALLEQPIRRGSEQDLTGWRKSVPVAADESILDLDELNARGEAFDIVNIKLDKCGGLTEALLMADRAKAMGLRVMVGNMAGSSLAAAAGFVLAQVCDVVDLDGAFFLAEDPHAVSIYRSGLIDIPEGFWGAVTKNE